MTNQPKWKHIGSIGDIDPIAYGGGFIYQDQTGIYPPELTYFEPAPDEDWHKTRGNTPLQVYRIILENNPQNEFWYSKLSDVARTVGQPLEDLQRMAGGTPLERAYVYECLIHYFGANEFDSCPIQTTEGKAYFRYWREMKKNLNREDSK